MLNATRCVLIATVTLEMVIHLNYVTGQDLLPQDTRKCNFKGPAVVILSFILISPKNWKQSKNVFENIMGIPSISTGAKKPKCTQFFEN